MCTVTNFDRMTLLDMSHGWVGVPKMKDFDIITVCVLWVVAICTVTNFDRVTLRMFDGWMGIPKMKDFDIETV